MKDLQALNNSHDNHERILHEMALRIHWLEAKIEGLICHCKQPPTNPTIPPATPPVVTTTIPQPGQLPNSTASTNG